MNSVPILNNLITAVARHQQTLLVISVEVQQFTVERVEQ